MTARDLEGPVVRVRKKLFQFVGVLRVAETIAEQDRSAFEISGLPSVQKMVGGGQGEPVTGVRGSVLLGRMAGRSSPAWDCRKDRQKEKACCYMDLQASVVPRSLH
jgi:hypothetical protein